jgi:hypothetical protein
MNKLNLQVGDKVIVYTNSKRIIDGEINCVTDQHYYIAVPIDDIVILSDLKGVGKDFRIEKKETKMNYMKKYLEGKHTDMTDLEKFLEKKGALKEFYGEAERQGVDLDYGDNRTNLSSTFPWPESASGFNFWDNLHTEFESYFTEPSAQNIPLDPLKIQHGGSHYKELKIQPIEFIMANNLDFCQGNAIKYLVRFRNKNGLEDLKKAKHYIDLLIQHEYGKDTI